MRHQSVLFLPSWGSAIRGSGAAGAPPAHAPPVGRGRPCPRPGALGPAQLRPPAVDAGLELGAKRMAEGNTKVGGRL